MIINILSFSCPLILCSIGALFSEYAGALALFLEGLISFSAFLNYAFTISTNSAIAGFILSVFCTCLIVAVFSIIIERFNANKFIAGIALNLLFSALPSCLSSLLYGNRGVLTSSRFSFNLLHIKIFAIIITIISVSAAIIFLFKTRPGLYIRITGTDSETLYTNGINPLYTRAGSWIIAAMYSSLAGCLLSMRLSSFVPNISSGRGWMALAAVFVGQKKAWKILVCMIVFCCADFFSTNIQNILPQIPSSVLLSFPYLIVLCLVFSNRV